MVILPTVLLIKFQPKNMPDNPDENGDFRLSAAEGIGRTGVIIAPLFATIHLDNTYEEIAMSGMIITLILYYFGWIRYFKGGREYELMFSPMAGIPVPLAVTPVLFFLCATLVLHSPYMLAATVVFGIGHIANSMKKRPS